MKRIGTDNGWNLEMFFRYFDPAFCQFRTLVRAEAQPGICMIRKDLFRGRECGKPGEFPEIVPVSGT